MRRSFLPLIAAISLVSGSAWSAEYQLKHPNLKVGATVNLETSVQFEDAEMVMSLGAQTLKGKMTMANREVMAVKVLTTDAGKPTELETFYKESTEKQETSLNGQTNSDTKNEPLHGATVISKRVNGKWDSQLKAGQATDKQKEALEQFDELSSDELYEDRAVKVGETWTVPPERVEKLLSGALATGAKGTAKCKFDRVESFAGKQCAVIAIEIVMTGKAPGQEADLTIEMDLKGTVYRSLDEKVDLKVEMSGKAKMHGPIPEAQGAKLEVTGPMKLTQAATIEK